MRVVDELAFDRHTTNIFGTLQRLVALFADAGVDYRLVGGLAVYLHVTSVESDAGRSTQAVDVAIRRTDLDRIQALAPQHGFQFRHAAGVDMLVDAKTQRARGGIHFVFSQEKVRPEYVAAVPALQGGQTGRFGVLVMALPDLLRMKLTSFRLKDQVHVQDLDSVGLITAEVEAALSPNLRERLSQVRASR